MRKIIVLFLLMFSLSAGMLSAEESQAAEEPGIPFIDISVRDGSSNQEIASSVKLLLLIGVIALAPSILLLTTSFIRIAVVLDFIKRSLSLQAVPPNQILMGIALFLTLFIMWPVFENIYNDAFRPYSAGEISGTEMFSRAEQPLRIFMYNQMKSHPENIRLFMSLRELPKPANLSEVPTYVLVPAFVLNELTVAFKIGILIFIPFIVIDMVVASVLMSMGMIMVPPVMISLPFKIMLFVLVDGWNLIAGQIINSFVM